MNRWFAAAAVAAMSFWGAESAGAQITTVVAPPRRVEVQRAQEQRREQLATQDSVARVTMTGMKEWVDSAAAALAVTPDTGARAAGDSAARVATVDTTQRAQDTTVVAAERVPTRRPRDGAGRFRDGAPAPDTATPLPTFARAGGILLLLGAALWRRELAEARRRTRR